MSLPKSLEELSLKTFAEPTEKLPPALVLTDVLRVHAARLREAARALDEHPELVDRAEASTTLRRAAHASEALGNRILQLWQHQDSGEGRDIRQLRVGALVRALFGSQSGRDQTSRSQWLLEHTLRAVRAAGVSREAAHRMLDAVYDGPEGLLTNELGGVGVALLALAEAAGVSADELEGEELDLLLSVPPEYYPTFAQMRRETGETQTFAYGASELDPEPELR